MASLWSVYSGCVSRALYALESSHGGRRSVAPPLPVWFTRVTFSTHNENTLGFALDAVVGISDGPKNLQWPLIPSHAPPPLRRLYLSSLSFSFSCVRTLLFSMRLLLTQLTIADLATVTKLRFLTTLDHVDREILEPFPKLVALVKSVSEEPKIAAFIAKHAK